MLSSAVSMLFPVQGENLIYENFFRQYSLFTSSNLIIFDLIKNTNEAELLHLFENSDGIINDYQERDVLLIAMGLSDNTPQKSEQRGFALDFFQQVTKKKVSAKTLLLSFINIKEFLLLYALFEGAMKDIFRANSTLPAGCFLKEMDIIKYLEKSFPAEQTSFLDNLKTRSPLSHFTELEAFWDYFTYFRHLFFHAGGYPTQQWLDHYGNKKENLLQSIVGFEDVISANFLIDAISEHNPTRGDLFFIQDNYANLFRNYVVRVMEAVYLTRS